MKRKILPLLSMVLLFSACIKKELRPQQDDRITISKLNVEFKNIETLNYHSPIITRFTKELAPFASSIILKEITLGTIARSGTDYYLLTIPIRPSTKNTVESAILIYFSDSKHFIAKGNKVMINEKLSKVEITDFNNDLFYSIQVNQDNKIGKVITGKDIPINSIFPKNTLGRDSRDCASLNTTACISCLASECASYWLCSLVWFSNPASIITWTAGAAYACSPN